MRAYLDHAATTPMHPEVWEEMSRVVVDAFGNPSGAHHESRVAKQRLEEARDEFAELVGAQPAEIVFTSGGTESNNLAIRGTIEISGGKPACTAIEHEAVLGVVEHLGGSFIGVTPEGLIDLNALNAVLAEKPTIISVMAANNETGMVQPLDKVATAVRAVSPKTILHTDAVQAAAWMDLTDIAKPFNLVSASAHKFGGPKGVGALVVRKGTKLATQQIGGGQEQERRSGTQNVPGIIGMATALRLTRQWMEETNRRVSELRDTLIGGIVSQLDGVTETGLREHKLPNSAHLLIEDVESEALLVMLDEYGVAASAASACSSGAMQPSHVLTAMGYTREQSLSSLRLTLGHTTTADDIALANKAVFESVTHLRSA